MSLHSHQQEQIGAVAARFQSALAPLIEAAQYAHETGSDPWDFAVEIQKLRNFGLSDNDLRFLLRLKLIAHANERLPNRAVGRQFTEIDDLSFTGRTCFVLTATGNLAALGQFHVEPAGCQSQPSPSYPQRLAIGSARHVPTWDAQRRVLWFDDRVVKEFRWQAFNQEHILCAFQEEGWPARIDDPLAPLPSLVSKRRLIDTIKCLNRKQANKLIRFRGDGTGQGVIWEAVNDSAGPMIEKSH
jgi:hypothetical protein